MEFLGIGGSSVQESSGAFQLTGDTYYYPVMVGKLEMVLQPPDRFLRFPNPAILLVTGGKLDCQVNGTTYQLNGWSFMCCDTHTTVQLLRNQSVQGIYMEYSWTYTGLQPLEAHSLKLAPQPCSQRLATLAARLAEAWEERHHVPLAAQRCFLELLEQVCDEQKPAQQANASWLLDVLDQLHLRYKEELSREQLAERAGVSPEHFSRAFRKHTGMTYNAYLNLLRIRDAQRSLLAGERANLQDLALRLGYKDGYYLSKKFKQVVGKSPLLYSQRQRRIVAANYNYTEMLRALGVMPELGAYATWSRYAGEAPQGQSAELFWMKGAGSYEQLRALQPDVIIGYDALAEDKQLQCIAPVFALPFKQLGWREQFRIIARVAGKESEAEHIIDRYNSKAAEARAWLDWTGLNAGTAMAVEICADQAFIFSPSYGRGAQILYDDLGFAVPEWMAETAIRRQGFLAVPLHDLPGYDADELIMVTVANTLAVKQMMQSHAWREHRAVRTGRARKLNRFEMFYGFDPVSTEEQLQLLMKSFQS